jgi:hypothetical protein
MCKKDKN